MRRTCLVNNYNYAAFVEESVSSALAQTVPFDEIIVVDDGSSDDSVRRLRNSFDTDDRVTLVEKENGGQLSALNEGFRRSTGELIFFLDADDQYEPDYVEEVSRIYDTDARCDFVFTALARFGNDHGRVSTWHREGDLGRTEALALARGKFVGSPTSAISARRSVLERILPMPLEEDWTTRADECVVVGCSLAGARKYYLDRPLVRYRVHGGNRHFGKSLDSGERSRYKQRHERMRDFVLRSLGRGSPELIELAPREFLSLERPHRKDLDRYLRIVARSEPGWSRKLRASWTMIRHYLSSAVRVR